MALSGRIQLAKFIKWGDAVLYIEWSGTQNKDGNYTDITARLNVDWDWSIQSSEMPIGVRNEYSSTYYKLNWYSYYEERDNWDGYGEKDLLTQLALFELDNYSCWRKGAREYRFYLQPYSKGTETLAILSARVPHNFDGTKSIEFVGSAGLVMGDNWQNGAYVLGDYYGGAIELDPIPQAIDIITANNFTDEENPHMTFAPFGKYTKIEAALSFDGVNPLFGWYQTMPDSNQHYFTLTEEERNVLRTQASNKNAPIYYMLKTTRSDGTQTAEYISKVERVLTIVDSNPYFNNPIVEDGNTITAALTGDINTMVKYHSQAVYAINPVATKGATIVEQRISCGDKYNDSPMGDISNVESNIFILTTMDSRNTVASQVIEKGFVDYIRLTSNIDRKSATPDGKLTFDIYGNYFNNTFGAVANTLEVKYRWKTDSGEYGNWITVSPKLEGNTYIAEVELTGFDYKGAYIFQAQAKDKLENVYSLEQIIKVMPIFDWSEEDFNFNVPIKYTEYLEDTAEFKEYDITENIKKIDDVEATDLAKLNGLIKAFSQRRELTIAHLGVSQNYSDVSVSLYLYGNTVRGYMTCTRNEAVAAGNVANELICQVEFDSGGIITGFGQVSFCSGTEGGLANFQMTDTLIYPNDGSVDPSQVGRGVFYIKLCATATAGNKWNAYFTFPCAIDLTKF